MRKGTRTLFFFLHIVFALYFLNYLLGIIAIPESFSSVESWIIFIGGVLLLAGAINYLRAAKRYY